MRVMIIHSNQKYASNDLPFPPVGVKGDIVSDIDEDGEYDVEFDGFPCSTTPADPSWVTHKSMVVFIGDHKVKQKEKREFLIA